jgi:hypothetical protein
MDTHPTRGFGSYLRLAAFASQSFLHQAKAYLMVIAKWILVL